MLTVIKVGGSILEPVPAPELLASLARLAQSNDLVIVHGGGKALTALLARLGVPSEFRRGLRVTDERVLEAALMTLAGTVNARLVAALNAGDVDAVGLTGYDATSVEAEPEPGLGAVGVVRSANPALWRTLLAAGYTPVLASLAAGPGGAILNVNADQFAATAAIALGASRLLFCTDVEGVLDASGRTLPSASLADLGALSASGSLHGGMLPKAAACAAALRGGVAHVSIIGPGSVATLGLAAHAGTQVIP